MCKWKIVRVYGKRTRKWGKTLSEEEIVSKEKNFMVTATQFENYFKYDFFFVRQEK